MLKLKRRYVFPWLLDFGVGPFFWYQIFFVTVVLCSLFPKSKEYKDLSMAHNIKTESPAFGN